MTSLWFKRSCGLGQDPDMQAVALAHGGVAIVVFEELMALSKITRGAGVVSTTWDVIALRSYEKKPKVRAIVNALDTNHLVVIDRAQTTTEALTLTVQGWAKWNPKDPTAADRQSRRRHGSVTAKTVTVTGPEEEKENREPPVAPQGGRARAKALYEQEAAAYAAWLLPEADEPERTQLVMAALSWVRSRGNLKYTTPNVLMWIRQHAPYLITEEPAA